MGLKVFWPLFVAAILIAAPVRAAESVVDFRISAGPMSAALTAFPRQAGVPLLFDPATTAGVRTPGLSGRFQVQDGLDRLLEGSGLGYRRLANGGYVIVRTRRAALPTPTSSPDEVAATTVPEILVFGRRSLNADIRRSQDDIQPYQVATGDQIVAAQSTNIEDFLRSRSPSNSQLIASSQAPGFNKGASGSAINLGGLGAGQTLVLVDGRRLPSIPVVGDFLQPDLNAIPPAAIDRIETLTSTASGVYGPGAVGGVVNVVLKRDFEGIALRATAGMSDRSDGRRWRLDASMGGASSSGATRVMIALSRAEDDGLRLGERDYMRRSRAARQQRGLEPYLPFSPSINIAGDDELQIVGGPHIEEDFTFLPPSRSLAIGGIRVLVANAGQHDLRLSPDGAGTLQSLVSSATISSGVFSVRQSLGARFELLLDVFYLDNKGVAFGPWMASSGVWVSPGENGSPFEDAVQVSFPTPGRAGVSSTDILTERVTAGALAQLPFGWNGELDLTLARARTDTVTFEPADAEEFLSTTGVNLFAGPPALRAALATFDYQGGSSLVFVNTMTDANLRLAGPLFRTDAGTATLTLLFETRRQHTPDISALDPGSVGTGPENRLTGQTEQVDSGYAELRAPLVPLTSAFAPIRGLELQLAGRVDRFEVEVPTIGVGASRILGGETTVRASQRTSAITAGFKALPVDGVMVRASYSTGYLPPSPNQLIPDSYIERQYVPGVAADPKRPGDRLASQNSFLVQVDGSPDLKPERAVTFSAGVVVASARLPGLRVSVDYTRIERTDEIALPGNGDYADLFVLEDLYPGLIKRGPLTAADAAKGYQVGPVVFADGSLRNIGSSTTEFIDFNLDYGRDTAIGLFHLYGQTVWQPNLVKRGSPLTVSYQTAGRLDGPLRIRANGGLDWSLGAWAAGVNVQVYSRYSVTYGANDFRTVLRSEVLRQYQGEVRIPAQAYVDATVTYVVSSGRAPIAVRFGVRNLFDTRPPTVVAPLRPGTALYLPNDDGIGYSPYGDPRRRRFEVSVSHRF